MKPAGFALVRNEKHGWLYFSRPQRIFTANHAGRVRDVLRQVELSVASGNHCVGYVAYEAAKAFDSALQVKYSRKPCAWFQEFRKRETVAEIPVPSGFSRLSNIRPGITRRDYRKKITAIKRLLKAGATYQVNFTFPVHFDFCGDPFDFFCQMHLNQESDYSTFIDTGDSFICSASPELFFSSKEGILECKPMKGTAGRGMDSATDIEIENDLRRSSKNFSENVMIVDMIRNDLGRVSEAGSVKVVSLFDIERYPTVFQATSTVRSLSDSSVSEVFCALFPCASVTGAPKVETMKIIKALEVAPRGIYTGALGFSSPDCTRFNVPIRTVEIDRSGKAVYGAGSGIVWESDADKEYTECMEKSAVLTQRMPVFELLETMRWNPGSGFALLEKHMIRLLSSAHYFGFSANEKVIRSRLAGVADKLCEPMIVRLLLSRGGQSRLDLGSLKDAARPWRVAVACRRAEPDNRFLYHKTTYREFYRSILDERRDLDDMIILNSKGELTESCRANLVLVIAGTHYTPPVSSGLLPGTLREAMMELGEIKERVLNLHDLELAEDIYLINSVRGRIPIVLEHSPANVA